MVRVVTADHLLIGLLLNPNDPRHSGLSDHRGATTDRYSPAYLGQVHGYVDSLAYSKCRPSPDPANKIGSLRFFPATDADLIRPLP
jgi:hypothetical protein